MNSPEPRRPDVPDALAAWQTPAELVAALEAVGLTETARTRAGTTTWVPVATLKASMAQTTSWPHARPTPEWRVSEIVVHDTGRQVPVYLTLVGRDAEGDRVALKVTVRRAPS